MGFLAWRTGEAGGSLELPSQTPPNLLYLLPYLLKNNPPSQTPPNLLYLLPYLLKNNPVNHVNPV